MIETISGLAEQAIDLMSSQQAMPDEDALRELEALIWRAYQLGLENG